MILAAASLLFAFLSTPAQIGSYVKSVEHSKQTHRFFGDASGDHGPAKWREYKSKAQLDTAAGNGKVYFAAIASFNKSKLVLATLTQSSPSGDWARFTDYFFRPDGTLAKRDQNLSTFYGNYTMHKTEMYVGGKPFGETLQYRDLDSHKILRKRPEQGIDDEAPIYRTTAALPFAGLLRRK